MATYTDYLFYDGYYEYFSSNGTYKENQYYKTFRVPESEFVSVTGAYLWGNNRHDGYYYFIQKYDKPLTVNLTFSSTTSEWITCPNTDRQYGFWNGAGTFYPGSSYTYIEYLIPAGATWRLNRPSAYNIVAIDDMNHYRLVDDDSSLTFGEHVNIYGQDIYLYIEFDDEILHDDYLASYLVVSTVSNADSFTSPAWEVEENFSVDVNAYQVGLYNSSLQLMENPYFHSYKIAKSDRYKVTTENCFVQEDSGFYYVSVSCEGGKISATFNTSNNVKSVDIPAYTVDLGLSLDDFTHYVGYTESDFTLTANEYYQTYKIPNKTYYNVTSDFDIVMDSDYYYVNVFYTGGTFSVCPPNYDPYVFEVPAWSVTEGINIDDCYWREGQFLFSEEVVETDEYRVYRIPRSDLYTLSSDDFEFFAIGDWYYVNANYSGGNIELTYHYSNNTFSYPISPWEVEKETEGPIIDTDKDEEGNTIVTVIMPDTSYDLMKVKLSDMSSTDMLLTLVLGFLLLRTAFEYARKLF